MLPWGRRVAGGRALVWLLAGCCSSLVGGERGRASAEGCFAVSCGCVRMEEVATTGTFCERVMGGSSCSPRVDLCPNQGVL